MSVISADPAQGFVVFQIVGGDLQDPPRDAQGVLEMAGLDVVLGYPVKVPDAALKVG